MQYSTFRHNGSDVHVFEWDPRQHHSQISIGVAGKLEPLSKIGHNYYEKQGYNIAAKINLGFFNGADHKTDHLGILWHDSGFLKIQQNNNGVEAYLSSEDHVLRIAQITENDAKNYTNKVRWGGSLSYALLIDGKINLMHAEKYSHAKTREPRTMIAQRKDKIMAMIVVDGRNKASKIEKNATSKGMTAQEQAEFLLQRGYYTGVNCDGGGSSQMIVENKTVNNPSDGNERLIGSALLVFAKDEKITTPAPAPVQLQPKAYDFLIDPGHGGTDPGGGSNTLYKEKDEVLNFSLKLRDRLAEHGINAFLTRDKDTTLSSSERTAIIKQAGIKAGFSIHINAYDGDPDNDINPRGYENIHSIFNDGSLAKLLADNVKATGMTFRRTFSKANANKKDYYFMHRETGSTQIIISELFFADNHDDVKQYAQLKQALIEAHCKTIVSYLGHTYVAPGGPGSNVGEDKQPVGQTPGNTGGNGNMDDVAWIKALNILDQDQLNRLDQPATLRDVAKLFKKWGEK